jgi:hypothetical protein
MKNKCNIVIVNVGQKMTILQFKRLSICLENLNAPVGSNLNVKTRKQ